MLRRRLNFCSILRQNEKGAKLFIGICGRLRLKIGAIRLNYIQEIDTSGQCVVATNKLNFAVSQTSAHLFLAQKFWQTLKPLWANFVVDFCELPDQTKLFK
jgi:hypothetical protein